MSCYTRHLGDWLPPEPTWTDRRALDDAVRSELGLPDADCPEVWLAVKQHLDSDPILGAQVRAHQMAGDTVLRGTLPSRTSVIEDVADSTRRPLSPDVPLRTAPPASGGAS